MWILLNDADLSVVRDRTARNRLLVRSRTRGSLERLFPRFRKRIRETPAADYRFRLSVSPPVVGALIAERLVSIDYDNFKNSVTDRDRHDAYLEVWGAMRRLQHGREQRGVCSVCGERPCSCIDLFEDELTADVAAHMDMVDTVDDDSYEGIAFRFAADAGGVHNSRRAENPKPAPTRRVEPRR